MRKAFSIIELILAIVILAVCSMAIPTMLAQITRSSNFAIQQELILNAKTMMAEVLRVPWDSSYLAQGQTCGGMENDADKINCAQTNYTPVPVFLCNFMTNCDEIQRAIGDENATMPTPICGDDPFCNRVGLTKLGDSTIDDSYKNFNIYAEYRAATGGEFGKTMGDRNNIHSLGYYNYENTFNDIDDYNNQTIDINKATSTLDDSTGDFLINTQMNIRVDFVPDVANGNNGSLISPQTSAGMADATTITGQLPASSNNNAVSNIKLVEVRAFNRDIEDGGNVDNNDAEIVILRGYAFNIGSTYVRVKGWL